MENQEAYRKAKGRAEAKFGFYWHLTVCGIPHFFGQIGSQEGKNDSGGDEKAFSTVRTLR